MRKIVWETTSDPNVFHVAASTDSPFQVAKDDAAYLAELRANGMSTVAGCGNIDARSRFRLGDYITMDADGLPATKVAKPETAEERNTRLVAEAEAARLAALRQKLLTLDFSTIADLAGVRNVLRDFRDFMIR